MRSVADYSCLLSADPKERPAVILLHAVRIWHLEKQLQQLARQRFQDFDLFVVINNQHQEQREKATEIAHTLAAEFQDIKLVLSSLPHGPRIRHLLSHFLRKHQGREWVIFLDDDQVFNQHDIGQLWGERRANTVTAMQAYQSESIDLYPLHPAAPNRDGRAFRESGAMIPATLFAKPEYWYLWPKRFWQLPDDWLNVFVRAKGWTIRKSSIDAIFSKASKSSPRSEEQKLNTLRDAFDELFVLPQTGREWELLDFDFHALDLGTQ